MRRFALTLLGALALGFGAAGIQVPATASGTAPGAPASCSAAVVSGGGVDVDWTAPMSDGGDAIYRYVVKIKGQSSPVYQTDKDTDGTSSTPLGGDARSWLWSAPYSSTTVFQVRAVNHNGFGSWCETPIGGSLPPPPPDPRPYIAYSSDAWMKQTTAGLTVDSAKTSAMRSYIETHDPHSEPNLQGVDGNKWGEVYDMSSCSDPVWKIGTGTGPSQWQSLKTTGFHADANFGKWLTQTSDSPFVVIDRCQGISIWAAKAAPGSGNIINVGSFGAFDDSSNGLDRRVPGSDSSVNERSRGVIPDSMVIRKDQLDYAIANHTDLGQRLEIFWWETDSSAGKISPPMAGFESGQSGWGAEGQLIGINPTLNLSTRDCTPAALAIAETLQNYGAYIGDNAGNGGTSLKMEQDHGQWSGEPLSQRELQGCFSWSDLVAYKS